MKQFIALVLSGCTMLLLAGCPKPGPTQPPAPNGMCGGVEGVMCPDGQYCEFQYCGLIDAPQGICKPRPQVCTEEYQPVCSCDGKTYGNACQAASAGVNVDHEGECAPRMCGGIAGISCPADMNCLDDPNDNCNPAQGGMDCPGICK